MAQETDDSTMVVFRITVWIQKRFNEFIIALIEGGHIQISQTKGSSAKYTVYLYHWFFNM